jgi:hypothetical protein
MLSPSQARKKAIEKAELPTEIEEMIDQALIKAAMALEDGEKINDLMVDLHQKGVSKAVLLAAKRVYERDGGWTVEVHHAHGQSLDARLVFTEATP